MAITAKGKTTFVPPRSRNQVIESYGFLACARVQIERAGCTYGDWVPALEHRRPYRARGVICGALRRALNRIDTRRPIMKWTDLLRSEIEAAYRATIGLTPLPADGASIRCRGLGPSIISSWRGWLDSNQRPAD